MQGIEVIVTAVSLSLARLMQSASQHVGYCYGASSKCCSLFVFCFLKCLQFPNVQICSSFVRRCCIVSCCRLGGTGLPMVVVVLVEQDLQWLLSSWWNRTSGGSCHLNGGGLLVVLVEQVFWWQLSSWWNRTSCCLGGIGRPVVVVVLVEQDSVLFCLGWNRTSGGCCLGGIGGPVVVVVLVEQDFWWLSSWLEQDFWWLSSWWNRTLSCCLTHSDVREGKQNQGK